MPGVTRTPPPQRSPPRTAWPTCLFGHTFVARSPIATSAPNQAGSRAAANVPVGRWGGGRSLSRDSVLDLIAHDKAGERILKELLVDADQRLGEEGIAGDIYLFKNNAD